MNESCQPKKIRVDELVVMRQRDRRRGLENIYYTVVGADRDRDIIQTIRIYTRDGTLLHGTNRLTEGCFIDTHDFLSIQF